LDSRHSNTKKPANIFFDSEGNVRVGDFVSVLFHTALNSSSVLTRIIETIQGLATTRASATPEEGQARDGDDIKESETDALYEAIDDISGLLDGSSSQQRKDSVSNSQNPISMTSITGGVGTTFYSKWYRSYILNYYSETGSPYNFPRLLKWHQSRNKAEWAEPRTEMDLMITKLTYSRSAFCYSRW